MAKPKAKSEPNGWRKHSAGFCSRCTGCAPHANPFDVPIEGHYGTCLCVPMCEVCCR